MSLPMYITGSPNKFGMEKSARKSTFLEFRILNFLSNNSSNRKDFSTAQLESKQTLTSFFFFLSYPKLVGVVLK